jgi:hypothetical protein
MSCDICGRGSCASWFHSCDQQIKFEKVIEAFDRARELRSTVNKQLDEEAIMAEEDDNT